MVTFLLCQVFNETNQQQFYDTSLSKVISLLAKQISKNLSETEKKHVRIFEKIIQEGQHEPCQSVLDEYLTLEKVTLNVKVTILYINVKQEVTLTTWCKSE